MNIPFYSLAPQHLEIEKEAKEKFSSVFNAGRFVLSENVAAFERDFAAYLGAQHCIGVGNGFDALFIALKILGIGPGDEVIVPAHTYVATWLAVSRTGASPIAVDADSSDWLIDTEKISSAITPNTRAIIPVHLYGLPCNMDAILAIARKHDLRIVEDNAQAAGATFGGAKTGTFGVCNAFSFYPTKNLGALGDGGAVVTNSETFDHLTRAYRNYGGRQLGDIELFGINSRLDEMQAGYLLLKLRKLDEWNRKRNEIALWYKDELIGVEGLRMPEAHVSASPAYHIFPIQVKDRDGLKFFLQSHGIETMVHYPVPVYRQKAYSSFLKKNDFPVAEQLAREELSLPIWPGLSESQVREISGRIRSFLGK